jgi:hypothetical protein
MTGQFPAINAFKEYFVQDFQQFKQNELANTNILGKAISASGMFTPAVSNLVAGNYYFERRN